MKAKIALSRRHEITDIEGRATQRAIMAANDYARQARIPVVFEVKASRDAHRNEDSCQIQRGDRWMYVGKFKESPSSIPQVIRDVYDIVTRVEEAHRGLYGD
jgi:phosphoribosylformylglycinamidine (FGAM) synthase PurS component